MAAEPVVRIAPVPPEPVQAPHSSTAGERPASPALDPLLVDIKGLSQLLARSEASLHRDDSAGRIPAGRKLGASKRWVLSEIVAWVEAGMPGRKTWAALQTVRTGTK